VRDQNQFLAGFIPFNGNASGLVVLDSEVNSDEYRVTAEGHGMMRGIDACVPQFVSE